MPKEIGKRKLKDTGRQEKTYDVKRILFYEMYKTGEDPHVYDPYRIVGRLMDGDTEIYNFDIMWEPKSCLINSDWISGSSTIEKDISRMQSSKDAFEQFISIFRKFCDYSLPHKRIVLCGFGNHNDDDILLKKWFLKHSEEWEYGKVFYPVTMDIMGSCSVFLIDVLDKISGLDLAWAAGVAMKYVDISKMNDPVYRVEIIYKLYKTRFCPAVHVHTMKFMDKNISRNSGKLNNLRRDNI